MIREATGSDADAIAVLSTQLGYPTTPSEARARLEAVETRSDAQVFVADENGSVLGWVHVFGAHSLESGAHAEIGGLVVEEASRGRGIGKQLMSAVEAWAVSMGYPAVRLRSNVVREAAHRFYEGIGYRSIKRQVVFTKVVSR